MKNLAQVLAETIKMDSLGRAETLGQYEILWKRFNRDFPEEAERIERYWKGDD